MSSRRSSLILSTLLIFIFFISLLGFAVVTVAQSITVQSIGSGFACAGDQIVNKKNKTLKAKKVKQILKKKIRKLAGKKGKKAKAKKKALVATKKLTAACVKGELFPDPTPTPSPSTSPTPSEDDSVTLGLSMEDEICTNRNYDAELSFNPAQEGRSIQLEVSDDEGASWEAVVASEGEASGPSTVSFMSPSTAGTYHYRSRSGAKASKALEVVVSNCGIAIVPKKLPLIRAGGVHTCYLDQSGDAWCWGENDFGAVGDGTNEERLTPVKVAGGHKFIDIEVGARHSCALEADGTAYCWGKSETFESQGALGNGSIGSKNTPTKVSGSVKFAKISLGQEHTCGIATTGATYCWGNNTHGQIGDATTPVKDDDYNGDGTPYHRLVPTQVSGSQNFVEIEAFGWQTCALNSSGSMYCWGDSPYGSDLSYKNNSNVPEVEQSQTFKSMAIGHYQRCAVTFSNQGVCWGYESSGAFGNGNEPEDPESSMLPISIDGGISFASLSAGNSHTCGLKADGTAYCWGYNLLGAVGDGTGGSISLNRHTPKEVFTIREFDHLSAGYGHNCAVSLGGFPYCWGGNSQGQLGIGTKGLGAYRNVPTVVSVN